MATSFCRKSYSSLHCTKIRSPYSHCCHIAVVYDFLLLLTLIFLYYFVGQRLLQPIFQGAEDYEFLGNGTHLRSRHRSEDHNVHHHSAAQRFPILLPSRLHQVFPLYEGFLTAGIQEQKVKFQNILQKENVIIRETNWAYRDSIKLFRFIR